MSSNKNRFYVVTQTAVVQALNKTEAQKVARQSRSRQVMWNDVEVDRIAASEAREIASTES